MKLIANISTLFNELPFCERIKAAADAGFEGVEIQFPYGENLDEIRIACAKHQMPVELINLPAGDWDAGDVGLAALPDRQEEFLRAMELAHQWALALGVKKVNVLSGRAEAQAHSAMFDMLVENLEGAARFFAEINVEVQLEVINTIDVPEFFVGDMETGLKAIEKANHSNLKLQFDFYHMARLGYNLTEAIKQAGTFIGHVQFADAPGRHHPGSGNIDFNSAINTLKLVGYDGTVSAEYFPLGLTSETLDWIDEFKVGLTAICQ